MICVREGPATACPSRRRCEGDIEVLDEKSRGDQTWEDAIGKDTDESFKKSPL